MIVLSRLEPFSREVARLLFERFPLWEREAQVDDEQTLIVQVPSPAGTGRSIPLLIYTDNEEVTVAFDRFHTHFGWAEQTTEEIVLEAQSFVDDVLAERVIIAVTMESDDWKQSQSLTPDEFRTLPSKIRAASYVRSWSGTYDREPGEEQT